MERVLCQVYNPASSSLFLELRILNELWARFADLRIVKELAGDRYTIAR
jgi:hypothetical protein